MKVSEFDFQLPPHLIAKYPTPNRSDSRLMHLNAATGEITHYQFRDLVDLVQPADLMVFNNTRVVPARFFGTKSTGGQVEILLERLLSDVEVLAQVRASKAPKPGSEIRLDTDGPVIAVEGREGQFFRLRFPAPGFRQIAEQYGHIPLPPYITRVDEELDQERYQTVYASRDGAVAAPTAGLHFDADLLTTLAAKGVGRAELTLHVGAGTFQPVRVENIKEHQMHSEQVEITGECCEQVRACRQQNGRVIAVGTTSVRSLEAASQSGELAAYQGDTDIFIYPGYEFHCVDAMITNFHLPGSTLIMLVSAFAGIEPIQRAYQEAINESYRFFSYGDAMLITR